MMSEVSDASAEEFEDVEEFSTDLEESDVEEGQEELEIGIGSSISSNQNQNQSGGVGKTSYHSVKYNFKPDFLSSSGGSVKLGPVNDRNESQVQFEYSHPSISSDTSPETHRYIGEKKPTRSIDCVLIWDDERSIYVLHRVESQIKLNKHKGDFPKLARLESKPAQVEGLKRPLTEPSNDPKSRKRFKPSGPVKVSVNKAKPDLSPSAQGGSTTPLASPDETIEMDFEPAPPVAVAPVTIQPPIIEPPRESDLAGAVSSKVDVSSSDASDEEEDDLEDLAQAMDREASLELTSSPTRPANGQVSKKSLPASMTMAFSPVSDGSDSDSIGDDDEAHQGGSDDEEDEDDSS